MKHPTKFYLALVLIVLATSCSQKTEPFPIKVNPKFSSYISAFTSGIVSSEAEIRIRLTSPLDTLTMIEVEEILSFDPAIDGQLTWMDNSTILFMPNEPLPYNQAYTAKLKLNQLLDVPAGMELFEFPFRVTQQRFFPSINSVKPYDNKKLDQQYLEGKFRLLDVCGNQEVEKTLTASQNGKQLPITWIHNSDRKIHEFTVDSLLRTDHEGKVKLEFDGKSLGINQEEELEEIIPSLGDFKIIQTRVVQRPDQYVVIRFSDPLEEKQNVNGLVTIKNVSNLKFIIEDNELHIYPNNRLTGKKEVKISQGLKNILGYKMLKDITANVEFEQVKPSVQLLENDRHILPSSDGMVFPFKAVNLRAVDVKVIRIFEKNIHQFLQVNNISGNQQMQRVGRVIRKKTVYLNPEGDTDLSVMNTFFLDLDDIIKTEKGAIYRIEIGFRKAHSLYLCEGNKEESEDDIITTSEDWNDYSEEDNTSQWDYYNDYYYDDYYYDDYYYDYDYRERDNPCNDSYYHAQERVAKNIFASDMGLIVKQGNDGSLLVSVSNILTTDLMPGVNITLYNYQQRVISQGKTDANGQYQFEDLKAKPFLLVAQKGDEYGYTKLNNGNSLSLSKFDVRGASVQKGIKGFIYGERGVWRPGDTLFLAFILEDELNNLPTNHPVTFELRNPRGQRVEKIISTESENNFYSFITQTDGEALTGNYNATVRVGGAVFNKTLKVETIKPNRLKIKIDFKTESLSVLDKGLEGDMIVKWLHGAKAKNLQARVGVTLKSIPTRFDKFKKYHFDDPVRRMTSEEQIIFDEKINSEGIGRLSMPLDMNSKSPGMVKAYFSTKVFEEGGEFSVDRFSISYAPYASFVGVKIPKGDNYRGMLLTDKDHTLELVSVDPNGEPLANQDLEVKVYKVTWRWWWNRSGDDLSRYEASSGISAYATGNVKTDKQGLGSFDFKIAKSDWGRYLVRVVNKKSGHATGKTFYVDWPGWAGRSKKDNPGGATMLVFSTDKEKYNVGDICQVTLPSSGVGRALVSVESGTRVIQADWVLATDNQTQYQFKVTEAMAPNVFVNITLVQPHSQTTNDLPIRMYGVIPIQVENQETHLTPIIQMPESIRPEEEFSIRINEKSGKKMTYTIAVVDEGLLDLTNYKTPSPWDYFYAREALGVKTWDIYDDVIGAYGSKLEKLLSLGGGGDIENNGKNKANRFKPVVMYLGPFTLEQGKSAVHNLKMPNYIGSVKTMVVAGNDGAYGKAEQITPVKKPLMVLATLPRVVGPGETVTLPVTIFAMEKNIKNVKVNIENNDLFVLESENNRMIKFNEVGDKVSNFTMKVSENLGIGKVKVTVSSGSEVSTYEIEIQVRNPNPEITNVIEGYVEQGQSWNSTYDLAGIHATNTASLEISTIPSIDFNKRLRYLIGYPHGCVEQTTSRGFPQLFLEDVVDVSEFTKNEMARNVMAAIDRLSKFQTYDGGLSYWPGSGSSNPWGTTYAGHFLIEAEMKGYHLPSGFKSNWINYQRNQALQWRSSKHDPTYYYYRNEDLIQAYRLYTLALANAPELGAMNRLRNKGNLTVQAQWRLAAAYSLVGQNEVAEKLIDALTTEISEYRAMSHNYGSSLRDQAMIIETLTIMGKKEQGAVLVRELCEQLGRNRWYSTQTTAYGLLAISKFAGGNTGKDIVFTYTVNGEDRGKQFSQKSILVKDLPLDLLKNNQIEVKGTGEIPLFIRLILTGKPVTGDDTFASNHLELDVEYFNMADEEIDVTTLEQGADFKAVVSIHHPGSRRTYQNMALTQIFPSGWEILNSRMEETSSIHALSRPTYEDIRDDRIYTYFDIRGRKTQKYVVLLNASYQGKYYLPSVTCKAMYDNTINARVPGQWVEVVRQGEKDMVSN